jgi:hypothetical protein
MSGGGHGQGATGVLPKVVSSAGGGTSSGHIFDIKRGDVVWAKVRGYSWWPAKVGEVLRGDLRCDKERKYRVDFLGDNTHQTVP